MNGRHGVTAFVSFSFVLSAMTVPSFVLDVLCGDSRQSSKWAIIVPMGRLDISQFLKSPFAILKKNPAASRNYAKNPTDITPRQRELLTEFAKLETNKQESVW
jgi:hypothetical protein